MRIRLKNLIVFGPESRKESDNQNKMIENDNPILTPSKITKGNYLDFEYQTDAVKIGIEKLNK